nr:MAG TPA: hypothetical protein [Caudoviricetes sp.]
MRGRYSVFPWKKRARQWRDCYETDDINKTAGLCCGRARQRGFHKRRY